MSDNKPDVTKAWAASQEQKSKAGRLRIFAWICWLIAIAGEAYAIYALLHHQFDAGAANNGNMTLLIGLLVGIAIFAIAGSMLWKASYKHDPASRANAASFFMQNQLGAIMTVLAFLPLLVLIFMDKDMDPKNKKIAGGIGAALAVLATLLGVNFKPASVEQYTQDMNACAAQIKSGQATTACSPEVAAQAQDARNTIASAKRLMGRRLQYVAAERDPLYLHALRNRFLRTPNVTVATLNPSDAQDFEPYQNAFETALCLNVLEYVEDPAAVGVVDGVGDEQEEVEALGEGEVPGGVGEGLAGDQLHGDEGDAAGGGAVGHDGQLVPGLEELGDGGVLHGGQGLGLVLEAAEEGAADQLGADHLEGDGALREVLRGLVDDAHAAAAQLADDRVAADLGGGGDGLAHDGGEACGGLGGALVEDGGLVGVVFEQGLDLGGDGGGDGAGGVQELPALGVGEGDGGLEEGAGLPRVGGGLEPGRGPERGVRHGPSPRGHAPSPAGARPGRRPSPT